jgi:hypothetical protein
MCPPNRQSVARISEELGIYVITLDKWRKTWRLGGGGSAGIPQGPRGLECCRQVHGGTGECWAEGHRAQRLLAGSGSASNASASCSCTPITAAPCVPPRWRCGWRRSGSCASYRARGCRTTTPTPWRCSALPNTGKYRPEYPSRPFTGKDEACQWAAALVDWYVHQHRYSAIKFATPQLRHSGQAPSICDQRTQVYEQARQRHPRRWSRSVRCWRQPSVVWIHEPADPISAQEELLFLQAA